MAEKDLFEEVIASIPELRERVQESSCWSRKYSDGDEEVKEFAPTFGDAMHGIGLAWRLGSLNKECRRMGMYPWIDPFHKPVVPHSNHGVPCGGLGGGSIGRGWRGGFNRWGLTPGLVEHHDIGIDQFSVRIKTLKDGQVRSCVLNPDVDNSYLQGGPSCLGMFGKNEVHNVPLPAGWNAWTDKSFRPKDSFSAQLNRTKYYARFPQSWTVFQDALGSDIDLVLEQTSPFLPDNYVDSSLPAVTFRWFVRSRRQDAAEVSIMFSWLNGAHPKSASAGGHLNLPFTGAKTAAGVLMHHALPVKPVHKDVPDWKCNRDVPKHDGLSFAIAVEHSEDVSSTVQVNFNPLQIADTQEVWNSFHQAGRLGYYMPRFGSGAIDSNSPTGLPQEGVRPAEAVNLNANFALSRPREQCAAAVCGKVIVQPGDVKEITFALSWDMPIARFPLGHGWRRRFATLFGPNVWRTDETNAVEVTSKGIVLRKDKKRKSQHNGNGLLPVQEDFALGELPMALNGKQSSVAINEESVTKKNIHTNFPAHELTDTAKLSSATPMTSYAMVRTQLGRERQFGFSREEVEGSFAATVAVAGRLVELALMRRALWQRDISFWQDSVTKDSFLPDWYKATLFNELYFLVEGGTLWTDCNHWTTVVKQTTPSPWWLLENKQHSNDSDNTNSSSQNSPVKALTNQYDQRSAHDWEAIARVDYQQLAQSYTLLNAHDLEELRTPALFVNNNSNNNNNSSDNTNTSQNSKKNALEVDTVREEIGLMRRKSKMELQAGADSPQEQGHSADTRNLAGRFVDEDVDNSIEKSKTEAMKNLLIHPAIEVLHSESTDDLRDVLLRSNSVSNLANETQVENVPKTNGTTQNNNLHTSMEDIHAVVQRGQAGNMNVALTIASPPMNSAERLGGQVPKGIFTPEQRARAQRFDVTFMTENLPTLKHLKRQKNIKYSPESMGHFLYLEGLEYLMYNTYDVHFYASWALLKLFPKLDKELQLDFATAVLQESAEERFCASRSGWKSARKQIGCVPHDLGGPGEAPLDLPNVYALHHTCEWKDLPSKFVLQVWRNYYLTKDEGFLKTCWPSMHACMRRALRFVSDKTMLMEHGGWPDHTYDDWDCAGVSAYSGGLWIAAMHAYKAACDVLNVSKESQLVLDVDTAEVSWISMLWDEKLGLLRYDSHNNQSVHSDMLAGVWFARSSGLHFKHFTNEMIQRALNALFDVNVRSFHDGQWGAANGMKKPAIVSDHASSGCGGGRKNDNQGNIPNPERPKGSFPLAPQRLYAQLNEQCMQSREVWTGVTYGLAATMMQQDMLAEQVVCPTNESQRSNTTVADLNNGKLRSMRAEAFQTARGIYQACWQDRGMWFQTPEAFDKKGNFRSLSYMRPLSIWALQHEYEQAKNKIEKQAAAVKLE